MEYKIETNRCNNQARITALIQLPYSNNLIQAIFTDKELIRRDPLYSFLHSIDEWKLDNDKLYITFWHGNYQHDEIAKAICQKETVLWDFLWDFTGFGKYLDFWWKFKSQSRP